MSNQRKRSKLQEKRIAEDLDGRVQKASGATDFAKGDVRADGLRVEAKTTSKKSYSLKQSEILKIREEALTGGADEWAMQIEFQGQAGVNTKIAVIDWYTYLELRKAEEERSALHKEIRIRDGFSEPD